MEGSGISCGIRINPEYSEVETELYNPCAPGTRFGVMADQLPEELPAGIEGFHCHCHCESSSYELEHTLEHLEGKFSRWFRCCRSDTEQHDKMQKQLRDRRLFSI